MTDEQIKHMVNRFLQWKLPDNFAPDNGISFEGVGNKGAAYEYKRTPVGTNLFDFTQAKSMVEYMVEGLPALPAGGETNAVHDVLAERRRHVEVEGWAPEHDDEHDSGEMAAAAACYAAMSQFKTKMVPMDIWHNGRAQAGDVEWVESRDQMVVPSPWPWAGKWWKPKSMRENLVKAGSLILAEIERLDRLSPTGGPDGR